MLENHRKIAVCALILQKWHPKSKRRRAFCYFFLVVFLFCSFRASLGEICPKMVLEVLRFEKMCPT